MVNQENSDTGRSWSDVWGSPPRDQNNGKIVRTQKYPGYSVAFSKYVSTYCLSTNSCIVESDCCWWILSEEEASERAKRAAAAARRWREYSRRGADRPPTYKLPEAVGNKD